MKKMRMVIRAISIISATITIIGVLPFSAWAEEYNDRETVARQVLNWKQILSQNLRYSER